MKTVFRFALLPAFLLAAGSPGISASPAAASGASKSDPATSRVTVVFSDPGKFTDVKDGMNDFENERGREQYLPLLKEHLEQRAQKILPAGQKLTVTFTDIDLAGEYEPWHGISFHDIRIVKQFYVPRLTFSFVLTDADGHVVKEGERRLIDGGFQMRSVRTMDHDSLRYEKDMLNDWLRQDIQPRKS